MLPRGDAQDLSIVTVDQAKAMNSFALSELANRYDAPQIILARARLRQEEGEFLLSVQLIDAYREGRSASQQRIEAAGLAQEAASRYDSDTGFGAEGVVNQPSTPSSSVGDVLAETFFRGPDTDFPALAQQAVEVTVSRYARDWKSQTLVDHSQVRSLSLTAWYDGLDEWAVVRTALEGTPLVRKMDVGVFTSKTAVIDLEVIGDEEQFNLAMKQYNLMVWQSGDRQWNIAETARALELQSGFTDAAYLPGQSPSGGGYTGERVNQPGTVTGVNPSTGLTRLELPDDWPDDRQQASGNEPAGPDSNGPVVLEPGEPETLIPEELEGLR